MPLVADKDEIDVFLEELHEGLSFLDDSIIALEENPQNHAILEEIFRVAHTIKGNAGFLNLSNLVSLGHSMESVFMEFEKGKMPITTNVINTLLECKDKITEIGDLISEGGDPETVETLYLVEKVESLLKQNQESIKKISSNENPSKNDDEEEMEYVPDATLIRVWISPNEQAPGIRAFLVKSKIVELGEIIQEVPEETKWEEPEFTNSDDKEIRFWINTSVPKDELPDAIKVDLLEKIDVLDEDEVKSLLHIKPHENLPQNQEKSGVKEDLSTSDTIRIPVTRLDQLMNYVGELVIANSGLSQLQDKSRHIQEISDINRELGDRNKEIFRISADIQELVMKSRLVPIGQVFNRFKRFIRDYSLRAEKKIHLQISGEDTEIDKKIVDEIIKPLTHIVRNSVDHGIEKTEERMSAGKSKSGTLKLHASQEGNYINIIVTDDGKGLDYKKIIKKAVEKEVITSEEALAMNNDQIKNLIFHSGLSTKEEVSDISGRGIGMDVVKHSIEQLNGTIDLESEQGKGTRILIKLPLTLAIINALIVLVENETFSIPMASIIETQIIPRENIIMVEGSEMIRLRNSLVPLIRLNKIFSIPIDPSNIDQKKYPVIVVEFNNSLVGILVNRFISRQEMVIKSLTENYRQIEGISGASILGDGSIILILDVHGTIQLHRNRHYSSGFSSTDKIVSIGKKNPIKKDPLSKTENKPSLDNEKNEKPQNFKTSNQEITPQENIKSNHEGKPLNSPDHLEKETQNTKSIDNSTYHSDTEKKPQSSSPVDYFDNSEVKDQKDLQNHQEEIINPENDSNESNQNLKKEDVSEEDNDELIARIMAENQVSPDLPLEDEKEKTSIAIDDTGKYYENLRILQKVFEPENFQQLKDWLRLGNERAIQGIKALTGSKEIRLSKSKGQRVTGIKLKNFLEGIKKSKNELIDFILPMLPLNGRIHFLLTRENAHKIVNLLFKEAGLPESEDISDDMELEPIMEVTNILGSAYTNSLSQITDVPVEPGIPDIIKTNEEISNVIHTGITKNQYKILYIENQFIWQDEDVEARLLILIPEINIDKE